ncbi:MAG: hypothetical protein HN731_02960 [Rhodospirillaceae bacterium]|jgi:predicted metal-dependent enzyme (double-stranded beta helix superfamily)|nr:hypothetical protein [Rhodospirillaceae bacterium]
MFNLDQFIEDCQTAEKEGDAQQAVREVVARAVSEPNAVLHSLGDPQKSEVKPLFKSDKLTILNVLWAPKMTIAPHNHNMWAVIGMYTGREDSILWRRLPNRDDGKLEAVGARALGEKDADILGQDIVHSVTNPISRITGAIHVYGGDFYGIERSEWDPELLTERPFDVEKNMRYFDELNARLE